MSNFLAVLIEFVRAALQALGGRRPAPPTTLTTLRPRVLMIVYNPVIQSEGGKKLTQALNWPDPNQMAVSFIMDLKNASHGLVEPVIVERVEVDEWPAKKDGFRYDDTYVRLYRNHGPFHQPDELDYQALLRRFDILNKVAAGAIDEVWCFAFPFAGFHESTMGGRGAFECNSDPLPNTQVCPRKFIVMGFTYERGVGEMLESYGHRCEFLLRRAYRWIAPGANLFEKFCLYDKIAPGQANCGTVHFAPNGEADYDWKNQRQVPSNCDDWLNNFPNFTGATRLVAGPEWGNGDIRQHHLWWLGHFPHVAGALSGVSNNWWNYVADPNLTG